MIQENLREIGIDLTFNLVDTAQFVEDAFNGNYDLMMVGECTSARYPTSFCFLDAETIASGHVIGGPKTTTDEIDALISEFIQADDQETAKEAAVELETILKENMIVSYLYSEMKASIINEDLKGYNTLERGYVDPTGFYK